MRIIKLKKGMTARIIPCNGKLYRLSAEKETEVEDGVAAMVADILEVNEPVQKEVPKQEKKKEPEISEPIEISANEIKIPKKEK
jgi:hypothetical protein